MRLLLFVLFSCSLLIAQNNLEKVSVQLDWQFQFEYAGYVAAKEKGFYRDAGLDVEIRPYRPGVNVVSDVLSNKTNYGIYNSSLIIENGRLTPIVLMATYLQHSPLVFVTQKGISSPSDLLGKKIMGTSNEFKHSALSLLLSHFGITPDNSRFIDHTFTIEPFLRRDVDAMSVYRSNQLFELDQAGIAYDIIDPVEYGFVTNAGNLFTSYKEALHHPHQAQRFIDATNRGWQYALTHSGEIIDILRSRYGVRKSPEALAYEARVIKKLMMTDLYAIGETNAELTAQLYKQLLRSGAIHNDQKLDRFLFKEIVEGAKKQFKFTLAEKEYLAHKKKITMCVDPEWYPLEAIRDGKHIGMAADVLKTFEKNLEIPIELIPTQTWNESLTLAGERRCDILSLAARTPERTAYLDFTSPYLAVPLALVTTMDKPFVEDIRLLKGKKIGVVEGYATVGRLRNAYPELTFVEVESVNEGLRGVETEELDGYVDNLVVVTSYIQKKYASSLKVSSRLDEKDTLSVATRNDEPLLHDIFEKMVLRLDDGTMQPIYNRWTSTIEQVAWVDRDLIGKTFIVIAIIVGGFLWRYTVLRQYNARLRQLSITDKLTGLYNRQKTDEKLLEEHAKLIRYPKHRCSVMIVDVDHFKTINDTQGHQAGDHALQTLAELLKQDLRTTDIIGRWGGEEFIVILPHTELVEAIIAAEHLRKKIEHDTAQSASPMTVSIGVGELNPSRTVHESIAHIDQALYEAKHSGRNRVHRTSN